MQMFYTNIEHCDYSEVISREVLQTLEISQPHIKSSSRMGDGFLD